jgi:hypothetical protein
MPEVKKWDSASPEQYPLMVGKMVSNLASLEFALRTVIYLNETPPSRRSPIAKPLTDLRAGDKVDANAITSWDSLRDLVRKYNERNPSSRISESLVELRDALAHGRILTDDPKKDLQLIRFSRPSDGKVIVEIAQTMSFEWLGQQIHLLHDAVKVVHQRMLDLSKGQS